jgi:hypothetical protein
MAVGVELGADTTNGGTFGHGILLKLKERGRRQARNTTTPQAGEALRRG